MSKNSRFKKLLPIQRRIERQIRYATKRDSNEGHRALRNAEIQRKRAGRVDYRPRYEMTKNGWKYLGHFPFHPGATSTAS